MIDDPLHPHLRASLVDFPLRPSSVAPVLRGFDGIKAVVFDFYDTLVLTDPRPATQGLDSDALIGPDLCRRLRRAGAVLPPQASALELQWKSRVAAEHARLRRENPAIRQPEVDAREILRGILRAPGLPLDLAEALHARWEAWTTRTRKAPHAAETLAVLRRSGMLLGIGSNAQRVSESLFSLHFGAEPEALGIILNVWSWRLGVAKPDPAFFAALRDLAARHHLLPEQILFVGNDPARDIAPAALAGFRTALYAGDQRCERPAAGVAADAVITGFDQLAGLVRGD